MSLRSRAAHTTASSCVALGSRHGELIAADTSEHAARTQVPTRASSGQPGQHFVSDTVTERVVDVLEVVQVEPEHRTGLGFRADRSRDLVELRFEEPSVGQTR